MDESQQHMEYLQKVVNTGEATEDTYDEIKEYKILLKDQKSSGRQDTLN